MTAEVQEMNSEDENLSSEVQEEPFPIPRLSKITNPKPAILPEYKPIQNPFNGSLFQLYFSLVHFHLNPYDLLNKSEEFSLALETLCTAYDDENENGEPRKDVETYQKLSETIAYKEHITRKFLLECQQVFFEQTVNPTLTKLCYLHNELYITSDVIRTACHNQSLVQFCDMLLADTFDLFNSTISKTINEEFWGKEKTADDLINDLLKKQIETIRKASGFTVNVLSRSCILRSLENAPKEQVGKIKAWANDNGIQWEDK